MFIPFILGGLGIASAVYRQQENQEQVRNAQEQYYHEYDRQNRLLGEEFNRIFENTAKASAQAKNELYYELESRGISSTEGVGARYTALINDKAGEVITEADKALARASELNLSNFQAISNELGQKRDESNLNFIGSLFSSALAVGGLTSKIAAFDEFREKHKLSDSQIQRYYQSLILGGAGSIFNMSLRKKDKNKMYSLPNIFDFDEEDF